MMGIEVPETCWAYHNCNKPFSDIYLVFLLYAYATMHGQTHIKYYQVYFHTLSARFSVFSHSSHSSHPTPEKKVWNCDSSVGILTQPLSTVPRNLSIPRDKKRFSHLQNVQCLFGAHTYSYEQTTGVSSRRYSGVGGTLAAFLHLVPRSCTITFMAWCIIRQRDNLLSHITSLFLVPPFPPLLLLQVMGFWRHFEHARCTLMCPLLLV